MYGLKKWAQSVDQRKKKRETSLTYPLKEKKREKKRGKRCIRKHEPKKQDSLTFLSLQLSEKK